MWGDIRTGQGHFVIYQHAFGVSVQAVDVYSVERQVPARDKTSIHDSDVQYLALVTALGIKYF